MVQGARNRERQQAAVTQLGQFALAGIDIAETLQEAVDSVARILDLPIVGYFEHHSPHLELRNGVGWDRDRLNRTSIDADRLNPLGNALTSQAPLILEDLAEDSRFSPLPLFLRAHRLRSGICLAIEGRDRPFGVLAAFTREQRFFSPDQIQFCQNIVHILAHAIEREQYENELALLNRTLEQRVDERSRLVKLLHEVAVTANQAGSVDQALRESLEILCRRLHWPVGIIYTPHEADPRRYVGRIFHIASPQFEELVDDTPRYRSGQGWIGQVLAHREPQRIEDLAEPPDEDARLETALELGLRTALAYPVQLADEVVAVLELFAAHPPSGDEGLFDVLAQVAVQLGRVVERQRTEEDLRHAKEVAEAAARTKAEFLANMSHEIRTPVNAVVGMTELLLGTRLSAQQKDFSETIRSSATALLAVIDDILDFSKIESGVLELEHEPFALHGCIEEAMDIIAPRAAEKDLNLAYDIADDVPVTLISDITRLRQILVNLLSNAVKFTPAGEVLLKVEASDLNAASMQTGPGNADPRNSEITFAVHDTGIGIPIDRMQRLFRPFSQVDASTTRQYGGTGLGLVISRTLCELLGGRMWADSRPGGGSTFHFTIHAESKESHDPPFLSRKQARLRGKHLLVYTANATNRRLIERHCERWAVRTFATEVYQEAWDWIHGQCLDVAILDTSMPNVESLALRARIGGLSREGDAIPLVMLTSLRGLQDIQGTRDRSVRFLTTPIKTQRLHGILLDALVEPIPLYDDPADEAPTVLLAEEYPLGILLVEDNLVNQKVALKMLEGLGYYAEVVGNGREALETLEEHSFDLVFMDIQMPEIDGLEASRRIRAEWPEERQPTIVAMTANALQGDREKCLAAGMDHYISKPVTIDNLRKVLELYGSRLAANQKPS